LWASLTSIALSLIAIALTRPEVLAPFNRAWIALGKLLNRVVGPVILAALFFGVIWPVAFLMRRAGNDPLRLKRVAAKGSCWVAREPLADDHFTHVDHPRTLAVPSRAKEILARAGRRRAAVDRRAARVRAGICARTFHLYAVLIARA
jgi:hypothetical protein